MNIRAYINLIGRYLLPFKNRRVVCPPGAIPNSKGKPVIVASMMRSGTHLTIDMLLNNFPELVNKPLYIDADQLFRSPQIRSKFMVDEIEIGRCIVKTHYPQHLPDNKLEIIKKISRNSHVLLVHRPIRDTFTSLKSWGIEFDVESYEREAKKFYNFWRQNAEHCIEISFDELIDKERFRNVVAKCGLEIGATPVRKTKYPVDPKKLWRMIASKFMTRCFGRYSPVINTGIRSGMTDN